MRHTDFDNNAHLAGTADQDGKGGSHDCSVLHHSEFTANVGRQFCKGIPAY